MSKSAYRWVAENMLSKKEKKGKKGKINTFMSTYNLSALYQHLKLLPMYFLHQQSCEILKQWLKSYLNIARNVKIWQPPIILCYLFMKDKNSSDFLL